MKKMLKASTTSTKNRIVVKSSKSIDQMIDAFEGKIEELSIDSCTSIESSRDVEDGYKVTILPQDYDTLYIDSGAFVSPGDTISLAEIKIYWNDEYMFDPILQESESFQEWFEYTREDWLKSIDE